VIDGPGALVANYRKTHLFDAEAEAFTAGDELVVTQICGLTVGLINCFDMEFPEVARTLADAGAQLLVVSSANMDPFHHDH
jgi:predicted amidohydrolase